MYNQDMPKGRPSDSPRPPFGQRLHDLRESAGLTQSQVAEQVGLMQIDEQMAEAAMIEMVKQAGELYDFDTTGIDDAVVNGKANYAARQPGAQQADPAQQEQTQPVQQVEGVV